MTSCYQKRRLARTDMISCPLRKFIYKSIEVRKKGRFEWGEAWRSVASNAWPGLPVDLSQNLEYSISLKKWVHPSELLLFMHRVKPAQSLQPTIGMPQRPGNDAGPSDNPYGASTQDNQNWENERLQRERQAQREADQRHLQQIEAQDRANEAERRRQEQAQSRDRKQAHDQQRKQVQAQEKQTKKAANKKAKKSATQAPGGPTTRP